MKIYINNIKEAWIVDRLKNEWTEHNKEIVTKSRLKSEIIWIIAPWTWNWRYYNFLKNKKYVLTIHHLDENDLTEKNIKIFNKRDSVIHAYHVLNLKTKKQLEQITNKPVYQIPFWINNNIFFNIKNKNELRSEFNFHPNDYLVGSFQRDTEGYDLLSPKLIKGPDRFLKIISELKLQHSNLKIVLTGKRRQYIISKLIEMDIEYYYFENVNFEILNKLYNCLNLYIVSSRVEGMPFAILECGITKTPVISTDVGIANLILSYKSIYNMENFKSSSPDIEIAYENSLKYTIPKGMEDFLKMFREIINN